MSSYFLLFFKLLFYLYWLFIFVRLFIFSVYNTNQSKTNENENKEDQKTHQEQENKKVEEEGHNLSIIENEIGDMGDLVENDFGMELNVPLEMNNTETNQLQAEENNRGDEKYFVEEWEATFL